MNYKSPLCSCIICHETKSVKGIFSHYFSNHDEKGIQKMAEIRKKGSAVSFQNSEFQNKHGYKTPKKDKINSCLHCNTPIYQTQKFCSSSCAATVNNCKRPKKVRTEHVRRKKEIKSYCLISWCKICNSMIRNKKAKTCSSSCYMETMRNAGKKSASTRIIRSKDEILLFELCKSHFQTAHSNLILVDGWDADIVLPDQKIAILWNGPWHYKQMPHKNHSLIQVQNRDRIKKQILEKAGWTVLIYEDRFYSPESAFKDILLRTPESN